ncbi:DMT family transporter [Candidatus Roizmanbacteria bacterium]|nr:DMT family transporter [Candidatus Roizmanbacteria bacterium]
MIWFIFILTSTFLYSIARIIQRVLLKDEKSDSITVSILFQLFLSLILFIFGYFFGHLSFDNFYQVLPNFILLAVLYGLGNVFIFQALKRIDTSAFAILYSGRVFISVAASSFFLHEGLSLKQYLGMFFIITSIVIVFNKKFSFHLNKGLLFTLLGALFFGLELTNDRFILKTFNVYSFLFLSGLFPAILTSFIYPSSLKKIAALVQLNRLIKFMLICLIYALGMIFYFFALQIGTNSSQIAALDQLSTIVIVILGIFILKEKQRMFRKVIASIISVIGTIMLII